MNILCSIDIIVSLNSHDGLAFATVGMNLYRVSCHGIHEKDPYREVRLGVQNR